MYLCPKYRESKDGGGHNESRLFPIRIHKPIRIVVRIRIAVERVDVGCAEAFGIHPHKPPEQRIVIPRPHVRQAVVLVVGLAGEPQFVVGVGRLYRVAVRTVAFFPDQVARGIRLRQRGAADVVVEEGDQLADDAEADRGGGAGGVVRIPRIDCLQAVRAECGEREAECRLSRRDGGGAQGGGGLKPVVNCLKSGGAKNYCDAENPNPDVECYSQE